MSKKHFVIILAAGEGKRMGTNILKQFLVLGKRPVLMHSLITFYEFDKNSILSVVLPKNKINFWKDICKLLDKVINVNTPLCRLCLYFW